MSVEQKRQFLFRRALRRLGVAIIITAVFSVALHSLLPLLAEIVLIGPLVGIFYISCLVKIIRSKRRKRRDAIINSLNGA
jgi:hypothetical protein